MTRPLPSIVKPNPIGEIPVRATTKNVRVDGSKVKIWRSIGTFEQAFCDATAPLPPDCTGGMDMVPDWGAFLLPELVKQACDSTLQAVFTRHAKWKPVRRPEPRSGE